MNKFIPLPPYVILEPSYLMQNGTPLLTKKQGEKISGEMLFLKVTKNFDKITGNNQMLIIVKNNKTFEDVTSKKAFDYMSAEIVLGKFDEEHIEIYSLSMPD